MNKRPLPVTLIACVFIAAGVTGIVYHASEFNVQEPFGFELLSGLFVRFLAIVAGIFALRGKNWARWLMLAWMTYHVILSMTHSLPQAALHGVLLVVIAYFLSRREATAYFRGTNKTPAVPTDDSRRNP